MVFPVPCGPCSIASNGCTLTEERSCLTCDFAFCSKNPVLLDPMKQLAFLVIVRWVKKHYRLTASFILALFTYFDKRLQVDSGSGHNVHCLGLYTFFEGHISEQIGKTTDWRPFLHCNPAHSQIYTDFCKITYPNQNSFLEINICRTQ